MLTGMPELTDVGCLGALPFRCDSKARFRTISGVCNNLENKLWGAADVPFRRFLPAAYADGFSVPRGGRESAEDHCETGGLGFRSSSSSSSPFATFAPFSTAGRPSFSSSSFSSSTRIIRRPFFQPFSSSFCPETCESDPRALLPSARAVSVALQPERDLPAPTTHLFTIFSQLVDHDVTLTPEEPESLCCDPRVAAEDPECFSFFAPSDAWVRGYLTLKKK